MTFQLSTEILKKIRVTSFCTRAVCSADSQNVFFFYNVCSQYGVAPTLENFVFLKNRYPSSIFKLLFIRPGCTGREGNTGALRVVFQCIMDYEHK